ncbi:hypothetical protein LCGC14_0976560 [marine sediment metagenome]|uniref:Uncharacterized protein n=1 Tax=marine sediment metagenome TaxID=412755 RepID=A0A0F9QTE0_9ZZZZ
MAGKCYGCATIVEFKDDKCEKCGKPIYYRSDRRGRPTKTSK